MSQVFCLQLKCNINIFLNPLIKIFTKRKKKRSTEIFIVHLHRKGKNK